MKQYMSAITARKSDAYKQWAETKPILFTAENDTEAFGVAMKLAREIWPQSDGYFGYECTEPYETTENALWLAQRLGWRPPGSDEELGP